ncbi:endonuclease domain-containing protein [Streptomyces chrestomyceticus]|uniref:endonuclease domain-containing protein n=1 Tax=Streptomyces chrestomyceticus TaxID=68185 RepID=UPI00378EE050
MPISREYARSLFTDLTQSAMVPLDPDELLHMPGLRLHGHVFFGDIAVRCYKHKARWMYDERDIRRTGRALAELQLGLDDVVQAQLPPYRDHGACDPKDWDRVDWRHRLVSWMFAQARHKAQDGRPYEEWNDAWKRVGANGLPGDLTWDELVAASVERYSPNMAGTRPLELLTWSGKKWLLPRAYIALLDRWEQRENELIDRARACSSCGAQGPYGTVWRTSTSSGYVTRCPPCSGATFRAYTGHLRGIQYDSRRRSSARADEYLCRLCQATQASGWDHCHEHGYVRGPLCGSCNTFEGKGHPHTFLQEEGSTLHLLECRECLDRQTLPRRYHSAVARAHLEQNERHGRCRRQPYAREVDFVHGVYRFELHCCGTLAPWSKNVTVPETAVLVQAFVKAALAAQQGQLSPGATPGAG